MVNFQFSCVLVSNLIYNEMSLHLQLPIVISYHLQINNNNNNNNNNNYYYYYYYYD